MFWWLMKKVNFRLWAGWVASYLQRSLSAQVNGGPDATLDIWKQPFSAVRASGGYPGNARVATLYLWLVGRLHGCLTLCFTWTEKVGAIFCILAQTYEKCWLITKFCKSVPPKWRLNFTILTKQRINGITILTIEDLYLTHRSLRDVHMLTLNLLACFNDY